MRFIMNDYQLHADDARCWDQYIKKLIQDGLQ